MHREWKTQLENETKVKRQGTRHCIDYVKDTTRIGQGRIWTLILKPVSGDCASLGNATVRGADDGLIKSKGKGVFVLCRGLYVTGSGACAVRGAGDGQ